MVPLERYRFTIWDNDSFDYVAEWEYVSAQAAEAEAIQVAKELSEDDDTWHGGWISVEDWRGHEIAKVPIGQSPRTIAIRSDGRFAYVTHSQPHVSVIDLSRLAP